jgi:hypothetical protein
MKGIGVPAKSPVFTGCAARRAPVHGRSVLQSGTGEGWIFSAEHLPEVIRKTSQYSSARKKRTKSRKLRPSRSTDQGHDPKCASALSMGRG